MKRLWLGLGLMVMGFNYGVSQFYDGFNYTLGTPLENQPPWTAFAMGDSIVVSAPNLSVKGLQNSVGRSISFDAAGADYFRAYAPMNSSAWYSLAFRVTALGALDAVNGGPFCAFGNLVDNFPVAFCWLRANGAGYQIGLSNDPFPNSVVWDPTVRALSSTNFIVGNYAFKGGLNNDVSKLLINPDFVTFGSGLVPQASLSVTNVNISDLTSGIDRFALFQLSAQETPFLIVDEVRVGTNYASVTPPFGGSIVRVLNEQNSSEGGTNGVFELNAFGNNFPITITYTLSGSATSGADYTFAAPATLNSVVMTNATQQILILPVNDGLTNETNPEEVIITLDEGGNGWLAFPNASVATNLIFEGSVVTNNPLPPATNNNTSSNEVFVLTGFDLQLKLPKIAKPLSFSSSGGFKVKGRILTPHTVKSVSYAAVAESTNPITNLSFVSAGKFKLITKNKLLNQGIKAKFASTKATKAGVGIPVSATSVQLITRVGGAIGTNEGFVYFTNIFSSQVK